MFELEAFEHNHNHFCNFTDEDVEEIKIMYVNSSFPI